MKLKKITIITAVFNRVNTIEQTVLSVINQSYKDIQYIIIDGGSTDGTVDVLKKYDKEISLWLSEKDNGIYDALNKGIELAKGDYIQILGGDDFLVNKDIIKKIVSILEEEKVEVDILSTPTWFVNEENRIQFLINNKLTSEDVFRGKMIPTEGMFIKTSILKECKFSLEYKIISDYVFLVNFFIKKGKILYKNLPSVYFSDRGISSQNEELCFNEHIKFFKNNNMEEMSLFYIGERKKCFMNDVKCNIKNFLNFIGILKYIQIAKGWSCHECENEFCRWCR